MLLERHCVHVIEIDAGGVVRWHSAVTDDPGGRGHSAAEATRRGAPRRSGSGSAANELGHLTLNIREFGRSGNGRLPFRRKLQG